MEEVYSNECGVVLRSGCSVRIEYVPEPSVDVVFALLTGGIAYRADGLVVVEFDQMTKALSDPKARRKVTLTANDDRPGLRDLAAEALRQMENN